MPDGHSIYIGEGARAMTMTPQEAMNVMQMAQNIQDLNTTVATLTARIEQLEQMVAAQQQPQMPPTWQGQR
jgi:ubiquinone biosynthesis protein UbiJ